VSAFEETVSRSPIVIIDGNIEEEVIGYCIELCRKHCIPGTYCMFDLNSSLTFRTKQN
jgi:hypothetical protein